MDNTRISTQCFQCCGALASILGAIDAALRRFSKSTAEELFKKSFVNAVEQNAPNLAELTETGNPKQSRWTATCLTV